MYVAIREAAVARRMKTRVTIAAPAGRHRSRRRQVVLDERRGASRQVRYLRISTIAMLVIGLLAIIAGLAEYGALVTLLGLMMVISGVVKIVALRIMADDGRLPGRVRRDG